MFLHWSLTILQIHSSVHTSASFFILFWLGGRKPKCSTLLSSVCSGGLQPQGYMQLEDTTIVVMCNIYKIYNLP